MYFLRRLLFAAFLVFAVSSASLLLTRLAPGDYATDVLGVNASDAQRAELRTRAGLDKSIGDHYLDWLSRALRFDFGRSLAYDRPVAELIAPRAGYTALLAVAALIVATGVGLPLGIVSGSRQTGVLPAVVRGASLLLVSMPPLLTSLFLVFIAARTGWAPVGGVRSLDAGAATGVAGLVDLIRHMAVPVLALALPLAAMFERLQAQAMQGVIAQPFVTAALARGVPRRRVVWRGALKASLKPIASIYGIVVGTLLSGSFAVEIVTSWPGLGRLMLDALRARDVYLVAGCGAAASVFLACGTLLSDAALAAVEPRREN